MALSVVQLLGNLRRVALAAALVACAGAARAATSQVFDEVLQEIERGDRPAAVLALTEATTHLSGAERAHAYYLLATLTPSWEDAETHLLQVLKADRQCAWAGLALLQMGEYALLSGDPAGASKLLDEAAPLVQEPRERSIVAMRAAQALLQLDRPEEARHRLESAPSSLPEGPLRDEIALVIATCAYQEGNYSDALKRCLDLVRAGSPMEPSALLTAANCLMARGEPQLALPYLEELASGFSHTSEGAIGRATADSLRQLARAQGRGSIPDTARVTADSASAAEEEEALEPPPPAETPPPSGMEYYVELGQFEDRVEALSLLSRVRRKGIDHATLVGNDPGEKKLFRVRVGPFGTEAEARKESERLEPLMQLKGQVVEER